MSKERILMRTMLITFITMFIKSSSAHNGKEACENQSFDRLSCLNVGCCIYNDTIPACLSNVGDSLCHKEQSGLWATRLLACTFGSSMICCFIYILRIRNSDTKVRTWRENYARLTFPNNRTERTPSSFDLAKRIEIDDSIWRRNALIYVGDKNTHRPTRMNKPLTITEESDIESMPEDTNKKNHYLYNLHIRSWPNYINNTFNERKITEMSEYPEELRLNDIRERSNILTRPGTGLSDVNSQSLSAQLSSKFGDDANVLLPWDEIQILELCGMGTYGKIYTASYDYMKVAVKVLNVPWEKLPEKQKQEFLYEIQTAIQVSHHENVLRVYGCTLEPVVSIVTELCDHGSVLDCIKNGYKLTIDKKLDICIEVARGVLSLHDINVLHRDIAARNVLLDRHMTGRIADFGMCRILDPVRKGQEAAYHTYSKVGPLKWMSLESLLMQKTSKKSDVWSFGITIWEIFSEEEPYGTDPPHLAAAGVIHKGLRPDLSKLPSPINKNLIPLLRACWKESPEERLSMQDVLRELIKVQQNHFFLQSQIVSLFSSKSPSSIRSLPDTRIYTIPRANSSSFDIPHSNRCSSQREESLSRKIRAYPSPSSSLLNIRQPSKSLQISPSQYSPFSGITSIGSSCDYPQYSSPEHSHKRIKKMILPQKRQNTEELGYRRSLQFATPRSTSLSPSSPKIGRQYINRIPSKKIGATQYSQELNTITRRNTERLSPILSMHEIPVGVREIYRNIDSSTTEPTTPENKSKGGTTSSVSDLKTGTFVSQHLVPKATRPAKSVN